MRSASTLWPLICLVACGGELPPPDVVARIDDTTIELAAFESYLEESSVELDAGLGDRVLSRLFDEFLDETLILQAAIDDGLVDPGATRRAALETALETRTSEAPSDEAVLLYYRTHADRFDRPERVRLSQILVGERELAEQALRELETGVPFDQIARRLSTEPAAVRGGDQGFLTRDDLPPAFVDTIFDLEVGAHSAIVVADYGFHLFQVTDRRPAERVPLVEVTPEIREQLRREQSLDARERLVEEARDRYDTAVYGSNLPFDYQGVREGAKRS